MKTDYYGTASQETALTILAEETNTSNEEVVRIYRRELANLEAGARIRTFIPALALHKARARLHTRGHRVGRR